MIHNLYAGLVQFVYYCQSDKMLKALASSELAFDFKLILFLQSNDGVPLLVKAAEDGLEEFVDDLLQAGSNPNSKHLVQNKISSCSGN